MKRLLLILAFCWMFTLCWAPNAGIDLSIRKVAFEQIQKEAAFFALYNDAIEKLKEFEGLRLAPYQDVTGEWHIGYGHKILPSEHFDGPITEERAAAMLRVDYAIRLQSVEKLTGISRYDAPGKVLALAHFEFQFGEQALATSTLLKNIHHNKPIDTEITRWVHATVGGEKVVLTHLVQRRVYELNLYYS